ncbi:hypothetical protein D9M69_631670 [compost metagenome]
MQRTASQDLIYGTGWQLERLGLIVFELVLTALVRVLGGLAHIPRRSIGRFITV